MRWLGLWFCCVCVVSSANTPLLAQSGLGKNEQEALDRVARNPRRPSSSASSEEKRAYDAYIKLPLVLSGQLPASALPKGYEGLVKEPTTTDILRENLSSNERLREKVDTIQEEISLLEEKYRRLQARKHQDIASFKREVPYVETLDDLLALVEKYPLHQCDQAARSASDNKLTAINAGNSSEADSPSVSAIQAASSKLMLSRAASSEASDQYFAESKSLLARMKTLSAQAQEIYDFIITRNKAVGEMVEAEEVRQRGEKAGYPDRLFMGWDTQGQPITGKHRGGGNYFMGWDEDGNIRTGIARPRGKDNYFMGWDEDGQPIIGR